MIIHVVQPGDTVDSIAEKYNMPASRIILDNDIPEPYQLVHGQTIVIAYPEQTHVIQEGETLIGIADLYKVSVRQLLRNNPNLVDRDNLIPGETLIISYGNKKGSMAVNGFAYVFINKDILKKTLPYLTYLTIFNYRFTENYQVVGDDDSEIIRMTKEAGVVPLLQVTSFTTETMDTIAATIGILYSEEIQDHLINSFLTLIKVSGYYGINVTFSYIDEENYYLYNNYLSRLATRLHNEGFLVFVSLAAREHTVINQITIDKADLTEIGQIADGVNLLNFDWSFSLRPPTLQTQNYLGNEFINFAKTLVPSEKIYIGLSSIAYDWPLPYVVGVTKANSLTANTAIDLARDTGSTIFYDEVAERVYFQYYQNNRGAPILHIVWFRDARSIDIRANQVVENKFKGMSIWNIMFYYAQMWLVINSQYEIEIVSLDH